MGMGTSIVEIAAWFDQGVKAGATHMLVVCDDFDYTDYPVFVMPDQDVQQVVSEKTGRNMQRLMECYALHLDKWSQLDERRAHHYESKEP